MKFQETTRSVSVICHYVSDLCEQDFSLLAFKIQITWSVSVFCHYVSDLSEYDLSLLAFKVQIAYFFIFFSFLGCNSLTSFQCMIIICLIGCSVGWVLKHFHLCKRPSIMSKESEYLLFVCMFLMLL